MVYVKGEFCNCRLINRGQDMAKPMETAPRQRQLNVYLYCLTCIDHVETTKYGKQTVAFITSRESRVIILHETISKCNGNLGGRHHESPKKNSTTVCKDVPIILKMDGLIFQRKMLVAPQTSKQLSNSCRCFLERGPQLQKARRA